MSSNKQFKIQNGVGITGTVEVGGQLVIDSDGKVVLPAISDTVSLAIASSSTITDLQIEDASIRDYVDDNFVSDSDLAATNARTAGISVDSDSQIVMGQNLDMNMNQIKNVWRVYADDLVADRLDLDNGGTLNAKLGTVDFEGSTVNFGSANVGGLGSTINDQVDVHLNQSSAGNNEFLKWNGTDYEFTDYIQGRLATNQLSVDIGGSINAEASTLDFSNSLVNFSGATINGFEAGSVETDALTVDGDASVTGDLTLLGSLNLSGGINQYNVTDLDVADKTITVGHGQLEAQSGGSGIVVDGSGASMLWNQSNQTWDLNKSLDVTGTATADKVTIGTSSASNGKLTLEGVDGGNSAGIYFNNTATNGKSYSLSSGNSGEFILYDRTSDAYRLFVSSAGNVGIGTSSPDAPLHIIGNDGAQFNRSGQTNGFIIRPNASSDGIRFTQGGTGDRMTIDASGNLLVGKTSTSYAVEGIALRGDNSGVMSTVTDEACFTANRLNSDGRLILFAQDTATVGSIGTSGGEMYLGKGETTLLFNESSDAVLPRGAGGAQRDGAIQLGSGSNRFSNLYLSGSAKSQGVELEDIKAKDTNGINFQTSNGQKRVVLDNSGNLALMTDGADIKLHYTEPRTFITNSGPSVTIKQIDNHAGLAYIDFAAWDNSSLMRLMNSGSLLVGKLTTDIGTQGIRLEGNNGKIEATRGGNVVTSFNRTGSDGTISEWMKDGTTIGSIRSRSGVVSSIVLDPRSGQGAGLTGAGAGSDTARHITPTNESGAEVNGKVSLGKSQYAFKDLYLSGGVHLGGTGAANKLDDYEEGTFTPTISGSTTAGVFTYGVREGKYTKVGNSVSINIAIQVTATATSAAGNVFLTGLPFSAGSVFPSFTIGWSQYITFADQLGAYGGGTQISLRNMSSGGSGANIDGSSLGSTFYIFVSGTYHL